MQPSDTELVQQYLAGDESAFNELYRRHDVYLRQVANQLSYSRGSVPIEDILQIAWMRVVSKLSQFRAEATFRTWLTRIVINTVYMENRREKKHKREIPYRDAVSGPPCANGQEETDLTSSAIFAREDKALSLYPEVATVRNAIDQLHPALLLPLLLHLEGYGSEFQSRMLGKPLGTIKSEIYRAKVQIRHACLQSASVI